MNNIEIKIENEQQFILSTSDIRSFYSILTNKGRSHGLINYTEKVCAINQINKPGEKTFGGIKKSQVCTMRRLRWLFFLKILPENLLDLQYDSFFEKALEILNTRRMEYHEEYKKYRIDISKILSMDPSKFHPLSQSVDNPWTQQQKNGELLDEIWKDITRTFADRELFLEIDTRQLLQRVIFTWTRQNTDFGYKQGMNELAAIFFYVNYCEIQRDEKTEDSNQDHSYRKLKLDIDYNVESFMSLLSNKSIEADTYIMFNQLMNNFGLKYMFQSVYNRASEGRGSEKLGLKNDDSKNTERTPIIFRCMHIYSLMEKYDNELYNNLAKEYQIEPQLIFLRWFRLLFSREFSLLNDALIMWDYLFLDTFQNGQLIQKDLSDIKLEYLNSEYICVEVEKSMPIVNFVALSLLLIKRNEILASDYNNTLRLLVNQATLQINPLNIFIKARKYYSIENQVLDNTSNSKFIHNSPNYDKLLVNYTDTKDKNLSEKFKEEFRNRKFNSSNENKDNTGILKRDDFCYTSESLGNGLLSDYLLVLCKKLKFSAKHSNDIDFLKKLLLETLEDLTNLRAILLEKNM
ncbi:hypothetical protein ACR3K2_08640 [Cryptosporidium serpentis]